VSAEPGSGGFGDILAALGKALAAAVDAYQAHLAEVEAARKAVAAQASGDLAAVDGKPPP
jgi:hypothetical protein